MIKRNFKIWLNIGFGYELLEDECVKQVQPIDFSREKGNMFYRLKIGEITLQNTPTTKIYDVIESLAFTTEARIKIDYNGLIVEGYFAKIDCSFDYDMNAKIVKIKPAIHDQYRYFIEGYEKDSNVVGFTYQYEDTTAALTSDKLQTVAEWDETGNYAKKELKDSKWDDLNTGSLMGGFFNNDGSPNTNILITPPYDAAYTYYTTSGRQTVNIQNLIDIMALKKYELSELTIWRGSSWWGGFTEKRVFYVTCKFSREFVFVQTSDRTQSGDMVYPEGGAGVGWGALNEEPIFGSRYGGGWGYEFGRIPFNGSFTNGHWELSAPEQNTGTGGGTSFFWTDKRTSKINYPLSEEDNGKFEIKATGDFKEMLNNMYRSIHPELEFKSVKSLFFFNDDESEYQFMNGREGVNYVTNEINQLNLMKWMHTYTLKTEVSESPSDDESKLNISFKKLIEDLQKLFPVMWFIDPEMNLHIEHVKFFDLVSTSYNISNKKEIEMTYQYEFDTSELFDEKIINQVNSAYADFSNNTIEFVQAVSNNRNNDTKMEVTTELFSTDLRFCLENPNSIANGLILLLSKDGAVISETGLVSGEDQLNGALSLSKLLTRYGTYEGVWTAGKINGEDVQFNFAYRSKVGIELQFRGVYPSLFYTTQIGKGLIDSGSLDIESNITKIKLRYRYTSNQIGDQAWYLVTKLNSLYDFDNTNNSMIPTGALSAYNFLIFGDMVFTGDEVFDWTI